jgi:hypothetical protein
MKRVLLLLCRHYACGNFGGAKWPHTVPPRFRTYWCVSVERLPNLQRFGGPGWRGGSELRLIKHLGAEAGFTEGWPSGLDTCNRVGTGCTYSRHSLKLLDYGIRGMAPVAGARLELSVGLGGGYIWHPSIDFLDRPNQALFQYSGKIAFALDRLGRTRFTFAVRTWRDLGRPTEQWLSTTAGISYAFGHVQ